MDRQSTSPHPTWVKALVSSAGLLAVFACGVLVGAGPQAAAAQAVQVESLTLSRRVARLESLLTHFSRQGKEVYITGANLHVVNGMRSTDTVNGLGNLVVGYNELREEDPNDRSGSHNLVVGKKNGYSSYGGVVFGLYNNAFGPFSAVTGGAGNRPHGFAASVSGGRDNVVTGEFAAVSGGHFNTASGDYSAVGGGLQREAPGENDWRGGGIITGG